MTNSILRSYADPMVDVRQAWSTDPRACGYNPWRGRVVPGAHGRSIAPGGLCGVCRFKPAYGTHCFLYEACDKCHDEADPCAAARVISGSLTPQP